MAFGNIIYDKKTMFSANKSNINIQFNFWFAYAHLWFPVIPHTLISQNNVDKQISKTKIMISFVKH